MQKYPDTNHFSTPNKTCFILLHWLFSHHKGVFILHRCGSLAVFHNFIFGCRKINEIDMC